MLRLKYVFEFCAALMLWNYAFAQEDIITWYPSEHNPFTVKQTKYGRRKSVKLPKDLDYPLAEHHCDLSKLHITALKKKWYAENDSNALSILLMRPWSSGKEGRAQKKKFCNKLFWDFKNIAIDYYPVSNPYSFLCGQLLFQRREQDMYNICSQRLWGSLFNSAEREDLSISHAYAALGVWDLFSINKITVRPLEGEPYHIQAVRVLQKFAQKSPVFALYYGKLSFIDTPDEDVKQLVLDKVDAFNLLTAASKTGLAFTHGYAFRDKKEDLSLTPEQRKALYKNIFSAQNMTHTDKKNHYAFFKEEVDLIFNKTKPNPSNAL